jgi:hypothetical protein
LSFSITSSIKVPNPHFLCRFSSENKQSKNLKSDIDKIFQPAPKPYINEVCGTYDLHIDPNTPINNSTDIYNTFLKLATLAPGEIHQKPYFSDIQIFLLSHDQNKEQLMNGVL